MNQIFGSIDNPRSYDLARATIGPLSSPVAGAFDWMERMRARGIQSKEAALDSLPKSRESESSKLSGSSQKDSDKGSPVFTTEVLAETSSTAADSFDGGVSATRSPQVSNHDANYPTVDSLSAETDFHCDKCRGEGSVNGLTCPRCGGRGIEPMKEQL